jgi:lipoprotein signal peptidase
LVLVPVFLLILVLLLRLSAATGVTRAALIAFVGAACANVISSRVWSAGVPDYIVFRHVDVVANTADVVMALSAATVLGMMVVRGLRRRVT